MALQDTDLKKTREDKENKNGKGFAVFFSVEQGVRNKRLWSRVRVQVQGEGSGSVRVRVQVQGEGSGSG